MFVSRKVLGKKKRKNIRKLIFYVWFYGFTIENINENKIKLKLVTNLLIFKLFNVYIEEIK